MERKLDCCVVRDLLPAYIEELTEADTSAQVREHLAKCESCKRLEENMRARVPVEKAPRRALRFLKRVRRTRLIAAGVTLVLTLWAMWGLYDAEFHYPNTEAGRLAAVEDYMTEPENSSSRRDMKAGTAFRVIAWQERDGRLYLFYGADNRDNVHGVLTLSRGINGKYRTDNASMSPFPYTAGVLTEILNGDIVAVGGDNCREIYSVAVNYAWSGEGREEVSELIYPVDEIDFLWLLDREEVRKELGAAAPVRAWGARLLDREGNDITEQFRDGSVSQSWAGGKSSAEQFMLYVFMGIAAILGGIFIRYFLRKD